MLGGEGNETFQEHYHDILQPLRNPIDCWGIDVAQLLDDFLETIHQGETLADHDGMYNVNFAEAALLLQGSASIYGKKVDNLWVLLLNLLEDMKSSLRKKRAGGNSKEDDECGDNSDDELDSDGEDENDDDEMSGFLFGRPVPPQTVGGVVKKRFCWRSELARSSGTKHPQQMVAVGGSILGEQAPAPPQLPSCYVLQHRLGMVEMRSAACNFTVNGQRQQLLSDIELYSRSRRCQGERIGYRCDQHMNLADVNPESVTTIAGYIDNLQLSEREHDNIIIYPESESSEDDDIVYGPSGHDAGHDEVDMAEVFGHTLPEISAAANPEGMDDVAMADEDISEHRIGHIAESVADGNNQVVTRAAAGNTVAAAAERPESVRQREKEKQRECLALSLIDPHAPVKEKPRPFREYTNKELERRRLRKCPASATGRRKRVANGEQVCAGTMDEFADDYHRIFHQIPAIYSKKSMKYTSSVDLQQLYFDQMKMWNSLFAPKKKKKRGKRALVSSLDDEDLVEEEDLMDEFGRRLDGIHINNEEFDNDADAIAEDNHDLDVAGGEAAAAVCEQNDMAEDLDLSSLLNEQNIRELMDGTLSPTMLQKLSQKGLDYFRKIRDSDMQSLPEIDRRVEEWRSRIQPILDDEQTHPTFDIQVYCRQLISRFPSIGCSVLFSEMVSGCAEYEVNRIFLCVLMLVNQLCVEVSRVEVLRDEEQTDFTLTLLSDQLHLDRLEEDLPVN